MERQLIWSDGIINWGLNLYWLRLSFSERVTKWDVMNEINEINIAGRLPENSRSRFVDRQSKNSKKDRPKKILSFHWRLICYILIKNLYKFWLPLLADLK